MRLLFQSIHHPNLLQLYFLMFEPFTSFLSGQLIPPPHTNLGGGVKRSGEWEVAVEGDDIIMMGDGRALQYLQLFRKKCMW